MIALAPTQDLEQINGKYVCVQRRFRNSCIPSRGGLSYDTKSDGYYTQAREKSFLELINAKLKLEIFQNSRWITQNWCGIFRVNELGEKVLKVSDDWKGLLTETEYFRRKRL